MANKHILAQEMGYRLWHDDRGYCVMQAQFSDGGKVTFWQQVSKWYQMRAYAVRIYDDLVRKAIGEEVAKRG